ncbi:kinase-like domain-containing protein [Lentinula raphanica]|uniref:Kinase-like domain-containing protein n=1 Tax=Lentinula raphanica TaxID=153919 RepID=A0AA38UBG0_9AGAR|nr:kinase-like domain-containing protein [Lentinula raphanica]KAJ3832682.1 kinase-like domain-containing protein [Lentinula raphanica]
MQRRNERTKWLLYTLLCVAADVIDTFLSNAVSNRVPYESLQPSDVDDLSDEEIQELAKKAPRLHSKHAVFKLTPGTIAKVAQDMDEDMSDASEANALNLIFAKTTIPVPRVRRVVEFKWERDYLIVLDYIKGPTLAEVWPTYSIWQKIGVAFTLRRYIRQLRGLKASPSTPPGPIGKDGPRMCESPIFGRVRSRRGPFASYAELTSFFNKGAQLAYDFWHKFPKDHPRRETRFDDSEALVLTHQDINPRNIIVGEDGTLWMIDWAWSGYYPPWFEYVAMNCQLENEEDRGSYYKHWDLLIPFVCGPCFEQEKWLLYTMGGLQFC